MKLASKFIALGAALTISSFSVHAQETFVGLTWGEASNSVDRSSALKAHPANRHLNRAINNSSIWGVRGGMQSDSGRFYLSYDYVSDDHGRTYKLRQQSLLASYDAFLPIVGNTTKLFAGGTAGLVKLDQKSTGFRSDDDIGLAAGVQVGVLQEIGRSASIEAGYRYLRTTADVNVKARDNSIRGSLDLDSTNQAYVGINYRF